MSFINRLLIHSLLFLFNPYIVEAKSVYVSTSIGSDLNDGLQETQPLYSIEKALSIADTLFLKAGDCFYETLYTQRKYIGRYGIGHNPVLSGYKRLESDKWLRVAKNIWMLDLTGNYYSGNNITGDTFLNNIGCFHEYENDRIHGKRVQYYTELQNNWDFWQTERFDTNMSASEFSKLYLYLDSDPNDLQLEFSTGQTGVRISNSTLESIDIKGFGFGVGAGTNVRMYNCHIDAVGGMLFRGFGRFVSYGNGIEFFVSKDIRNCIVENCIISRTYDSGITIQASKAYEYSPTNIIISNNLLLSCGQGWEDYIMNSDPNIAFQNCIFSNNLIINSGHSGFGYPDKKILCGVLGYNTHGFKGMILQENIFIGGNFYSSPPYKGLYKSNVWKDNIVYISSDEYLFSSNGQDYIYAPSQKDAFKEACVNYRNLTGDLTTEFTLTKKKRIKLLQKKALHRFLRKDKNSHNCNISLYITEY
ncbi:MAG: right-handed parallel beta-helix repeat-containing protein [Bacteroidales bacterium]|nr:right-handed parallel beta-helix repeat-containing protein [Bacteroidales bacterium]